MQTVTKIVGKKKIELKNSHDSCTKIYIFSSSWHPANRLAFYFIRRTSMLRNDGNDIDLTCCICKQG